MPALWHMWAGASLGWKGSHWEAGHLLSNLEDGVRSLPKAGTRPNLNPQRSPSFLMLGATSVVGIKYLLRYITRNDGVLTSNYFLLHKTNEKTGKNCYNQLIQYSGN